MKSLFEVERKIFMNVRHNLEVIKKFISHNINLGYLNENMTIGQLNEYINKIENNYLPMMEGLEKILKVEKSIE